MKKFIYSPFVFILILPAFFLLHNYNELFGFISAKEIVVFAIIIYLLIGLLFLLFQWWTRSTALSAGIVFIVSCCVLFFRPVHGFIKNTAILSLISSYK